LDERTKIVLLAVSRRESSYLAKSLEQETSGFQQQFQDMDIQFIGKQT
jgi:hypothetical protein